MKDAILSIIRHGLTFAGGFIVTHGWFSEDTIVALSGGIPAFIGLVWGAVDEYLSNKKAKKEAAQ